ncbi:hypothetical protein ACFFX0_09730 [Citricoccus parietis]|uniref:Uncharacterized protein n=1 Tax=Citricoccus parietis TaxID=592307 RepID=A0ABV5FYH6_9MICC
MVGGQRVSEGQEVLPGHPDAVHQHHGRAPRLRLLPVFAVLPLWRREIAAHVHRVPASLQPPRLQPVAAPGRSIPIGRNLAGPSNR